VAWIAALATRAELLLLDQPTSGLDPLMEIVFRECVREAKERGQTVFLSSHIPARSRRSATGSGSSRDGRLVDESALSQLRHPRAQAIDVAFAGTAPDPPLPPGVRETRTGPDAVRFELQGPAGPLIDWLAGQGVAAIHSYQPSLEEIFVHHYDGSADGARR
jgi:ABC-2 type transport system ATP-binding protein